MAEANEAEPTQAATPSRPPRRRHAINLCCAQSVETVVEEVARNLEGLGFKVTVVCGAEARAALLGSRTDTNQPTIHVVCVQGSLQERVLKPLRQALATHGGPNQHLLVAVLDLGVPLAMVGQIRRYAEALERPPPPGPPGPDGTIERRAWREHATHRELEPARGNTQMQVVERPGTRPIRVDGGSDRKSRRRSKTGSRRRAARISGTSKYQAVTASHSSVPTDASVRKRRRTRSRMSPAGREPATDSGRVLGLPAQDNGVRPPPPPAPGEMARRRSSTSLPAASSPPPPPPQKRERPSSRLLPVVPRSKQEPAMEAAETTQHKPWTKGRPPTGTQPPVSAKADTAKTLLEPDRPVPRKDSGFRFTPPGVKAAEVRTKSGRFTTVPAAELLGEEDRTVVQGVVLQEVPKTAATLKLDEPPFKEGPREDTVLYGREPPKDEAKPGQPTVTEDTTKGLAPAPPVPDDDPQAIGSDDDATGEMVASSNEDPSASGTVHAKPSDRSEEAAPDERKSKTVLYAEGEAEEPSERAKTLISESSKTRLQGKASPPAPGVEAGAVAGRPTIELDPEDRDDAEPEDKPKKTLLYADSVVKKRPDAPEPKKDASGDTVVAAASAIAAEAKPPEPPTDEAEIDEPGPDDSSVEAPTQAVVAEEPLPRTRTEPARPKTEDASRPDRKAPVAQPVPRPQRESSSRGWLVAGLLILLGGGVIGAYQAGLLDGVLDKDGGTTVAQAGGKAKAPAKASDSASAADADADAEPVGPPIPEPEPEPASGTGGAEALAASTGATPAEAPGSTGAGEPAEAGSTGGVVEASTGAEPVEDPVPTEEPTPEPPEPEPTPPEPPEPEPTPPEPEPTPPEPEPTPAVDTGDLTPDEQVLAKAAEERRIVMLKTLFVSRRQGEDTTTWGGGARRCRKFEVDGIGGWRLPHRREMKLLNAVLPLDGIYWTKTVPPDDKQAAYVLDTANGGLSLFLKQEPTGAVICVRRRSKPGK